MKTRGIIVLISFLILFLVGFFVFNEILQPSWASFKINCGIEELEPGVNTIGLFTVDENNNTKIEIFLPENHSLYQKALQHEECHLEQFDEGRLYYCNDPIGVYINEVECYIDIL